MGLPGMLGHIFGSQPAEDTQEADLRDASCGPPPGGGCGPPTSCEVDFICKASPQPSGRACDFRGAALRPGAAAGCSTSPTSNLLAGVFSKTGGGCGLRRLLIEAANSKCKIQDSKLPLGTQPAEDTQLRLRTAGLRRPQAAARSVLTNRRRLRITAPG